MKKVSFLLLILLGIFGLQAQELTIIKEVEWPRANIDSLTWRTKYCNGLWKVVDSAMLKNARIKGNAMANYDEDEKDPRFKEYLKAEKKWRMRCMKALPVEIQKKLERQAKEEPKWMAGCMFGIYFNKNGDVLVITYLRLVGTLFENLTREEIDILFRTVAKIKVPLVEFYDFSPGNEVANKILELPRGMYDLSYP